MAMWPLRSSLHEAEKALDTPVCNLYFVTLAIISPG